MEWSMRRDAENWLHPELFDRSTGQNSTYVVIGAARCVVTSAERTRAPSALYRDETRREVCKIELDKYRRSQPGLDTARERLTHSLLRLRFYVNIGTFSEIPRLRNENIVTVTWCRLWIGMLSRIRIVIREHFFFKDSYSLSLGVPEIHLRLNVFDYFFRSSLGKLYDDPSVMFYSQWCPDLVETMSRSRHKTLWKESKFLLLFFVYSNF